MVGYKAYGKGDRNKSITRKKKEKKRRKKGGEGKKNKNIYIRGKGT